MHGLRSPYPPEVMYARETERTDPDRADTSLVLASGSPRRAEMLRAAGFDPEIEPADIDDSALVPGSVDGAAFATSLAYFKARRVAARRAARGAAPAWILAADTVTETDGRLVGKPVDSAEARAMIRAFMGRGHRVATGWCLLSPAGAARMGRDVATVTLGAVPEASLERFLDERRWEGKAGGYDLAEVAALGWPIACDGDPETVRGLPVARLSPLLRDAIGAAGGRSIGDAPRRDAHDGGTA
jgi:septum formation protein